MDNKEVITYYEMDSDGDIIEQDLVDDDGDYLDPVVAFGEPE